LAPPRETEARTGDAAPAPGERAGARVYKEVPETKSSGAKYRSESIRNFDRTTDAVKNVTTMVREGIGPLRPTGHYVSVPRGDYAAQQPPGALSNDPVVGAAAGIAMVAEAVRAARRARARRKRERDGSDG
jgi:hypothetical protein